MTMLHLDTPIDGAAPPVTSYREMPPPIGLAPFVTCLWTHTSFGDTRITRVVPDGCVDLMWITDGGASRLVLAGPDTHAHLSALGPGGTIAGVRFAPGTAASVLGTPLHALRDTRPELADVWDRSVADTIAEAAADSERPELVLADAVAARVVEPPDPAVRHVARALGSTRHPAPVGVLAAEMGLSERQLHRRCTVAFGYGPKTLHRVLRFQSALALARTGCDLASVAYECGYADQPHLARDVAALAGASMRSLLEG
jgi:AraC-like DNA-binding protein